MPSPGTQGPLSVCLPLRLAAGSVDSLIGNLRAIFKENDRARDWEERLGLGNPAASLLVRKYLKCVKEEQATAGLTPQQATPLFVDKLTRLSVSDHLDRQLEACKNDSIRMYILSSDQAYFKTLFFSGDRPGNLGQVQTNEILRFPNEDGLLFNHTWGKTLHGDRLNLFGIKRCANIKIYPVAAIERYMATTRAMQVDLTGGFLFRPSTAQGAISPLSISSEAMSSRLKTYLREAAIDDDETAHGLARPAKPLKERRRHRLHMDYYEVLVIPFKILFIFKKRKRWIKPMTCDPIPILAPIPDGMIAIDVTVAKINEDVVTALGVLMANTFILISRDIGSLV